MKDLILNIFLCCLGLSLAVFTVFNFFSGFTAWLLAFIILFCAAFLLRGKALKSSEIQRETYISIINHDIKIPVLAQIRAIKFFLEENTGNLNKVQRELMELTLDSGKLVYEMLSNIVDTYKFDNRLQLHIEGVRLYPLLDGCFAKCSQLVSSKNLTINLFPDDNSLTAGADKIQIKKAFEKITEQCVTTAQEDTEISCKIMESKKDISVEFSFNSTTFCPEVFEINSKDNMDKVGTVLSLYLAKQIIKAHGGNIKVKSKGETYILNISLPLLTNVKK